MPQWLLARFYEHHKKEPEFAQNATINWMHALRMAVDSQSFSSPGLVSRYSHVQRRRANQTADNSAFENLLLSLHYRSSVEHLASRAAWPYEIVRSAIISWYYSIYFASKAMIAAQSGLDAETHTKNIKIWQRDIVESGRSIHPFDFSLKDISPKSVKQFYRSGAHGNSRAICRYTLPANDQEATEVISSYQRGTIEFFQEKRIKEIKNSREFKELHVSNFHSHKAQAVRDQFLKNDGVNYLSQAFRYRGKANYRDAIYLSYGVDHRDRISGLISDLKEVSTKFILMAAAFTSRRVERGVWSDFTVDLQTNARFVVGVDISYFS